MSSKSFTKILISFVMVVLVAVSACQKDPDLKETGMGNKSFVADSTTISAVKSTGNNLAVKGTLSIKINDSLYVFDAIRDSIAFINVESGDSSRYFGITAINKEHTMSFCISSSGIVKNSINSNIAGSQFLIAPNENKPIVQYSLSKYSGQKDFGNINIIKYHQDSVLAKGTFFTFLAKDDKINSPFYRIEGSFNLLLR